MGGGMGLPMGGGGLGIGTIIVLGLIGYAFGIDPRILIGGAEILNHGGAPTQQADRRSPRQVRRAQGRDGRHDLRRPRRDRRPLDRDLPGQSGRAIPDRRSCCSATAPMVAAAAWRSRRWGRSTVRRRSRSSSTRRFFREVETRFRGCSGSACKFTAGLHHRARGGPPYAEPARHPADACTRLQQQSGSKAEANALQVKVELQADCLSGVWVNREAKKRPGFLEEGDIDAALHDGLGDRRRYACSVRRRDASCRTRSRTARPRSASAGS